MSVSNQIETLYEAMLSALGPSYWWPGESPLEIAVGAVLTQNTNWSNVEKAMDRLKQSRLLDCEALSNVSLAELSEIIRPAGYHNIKAKRLKNLISWLREFDCDFESIGKKDVYEVRSSLLNVNGVGPETADSIILYAMNMPTFVVDAYTARIFHRHGLIHEDVDYHELQSLCVDALPEDVAVYNECHALIVRIGKEWCKKKAGLCGVCPLSPLLPHEVS